MEGERRSRKGRMENRERVLFRFVVVVVVVWHAKLNSKKERKIDSKRQESMQRGR